MRCCLIVDQDEAVRRSVEDAVRAAAKGVREHHAAGDAASAMRLFDAERPDVVFLDMAHVALLDPMLTQRPGVHVVLLTAATGAQPEMVDAISLGAIAALRKPVRAEEVRFVLESIDPEKARMDYFG